MTHWDTLVELGERFAGVDIQIRRTTPFAWRGAWRVRVLASKNERSDYRVTAYGDTLEDVVEDLRVKLPEGTL